MGGNQCSGFPAIRCLPHCARAIKPETIDRDLAERYENILEEIAHFATNIFD